MDKVLVNGYGNGNEDESVIGIRSGRNGWEVGKGKEKVSPNQIDMNEHGLSDKYLESITTHTTHTYSENI